MKATFAHGFWLVIEKVLRWSIHPRLRARIYGALGAQIGRNVRVYEVQLFNLATGFRNLRVDDDAHIGPGCKVDLAAPLVIGARSTLSPGVTILTHADPGKSHGSELARIYPPRFDGVSLGRDCWVGANATLLAGCRLGNRVVVGAASVVRDSIPDDSLAAGVPATVRKRLEF
jgi:maltose O-acetyltransferase